MKILLSEEQIEKLLKGYKLTESHPEDINELGDTEHVMDRLYKRVLKNRLPVFIRKVIKPQPGTYSTNRVLFELVGYYYFNQSELNEINEKIIQLFSYDYQKNKSFGIQLKRFDIQRRLDQIKFIPLKKDMAIENKNLLCFADFDDYYNGNLDASSKAWGDALALIIRTNNATTIFWGDGNKFDETYLGVNFYIRKIQTHIKMNSTNPSEVPPRIQEFVKSSINMFDKKDDDDDDDDDGSNGGK